MKEMFECFNIFLKKKKFTTFAFNFRNLKFIVHKIYKQ